MKNKFQESIHANHIGFVISEILMTVGSILFLIAFIIISKEDYEYAELYSLLEMRRYGLALALSGIISMITCACNIGLKSDTMDKIDKAVDHAKKSRNIGESNELSDTLLLTDSEKIEVEKILSEDQNNKFDT